MIESFLKRQGQLVQQLFTYCYQSDHSLFHFKRLTKVLNITHPTLHKVLDQMEEIQKKYPEFSMERGKRTVTMTFSETFLLNKIHIYLIKKTLPFAILDTIFYQSFSSLDHFSQQQYISRRTAQRQVSLLTPILEPYELKLNLKKMNYLEGEEYRIRYFFHQVYWHIYDEIDSNCPPIRQKSKEELYQKLSQYFPFMNHISKERFIQLSAISVIRIKQGYLLKEIPETMIKLYNLFMSRGVFEEKILRPFFEAQSLYSNDLSKEEFIYLYYMFTIDQIYSQETLAQIQLQAPPFLSDYLRFMKEWVYQIETHLKRPFGQDERRFLLVNTTYLFSFLTTFGLQNTINSLGPSFTVSEIEEPYRYLFTLLEQISQKIAIKQQNRRAIFQSSLLHYEVAQMLYQILMDYDLPIRVAVESKGRGGKEELQQQKLVRISSHPILLVRMEEHPDVVISDYPMNLSRYFQEEVPSLFQWGECQYVTDWLRVLQLINRIREQRYVNLSS